MFCFLVKKKKTAQHVLGCWLSPNKCQKAQSHSQAARGRNCQTADAQQPFPERLSS